MFGLRDMHIQEWTHAVHAWAHDVLLNPGYVLTPACLSGGCNFVECWSSLLRCAAHVRVDALISEIGVWWTALRRDAVVRKLVEGCGR